MADTWSFSDSTDTAVFTLRLIVFNYSPILRVVHDKEDGSWQFIGWESPEANEIAVVGLGEMIALDPSLSQLADLPLGWEAWRVGKDEPWIRSVIKDD
jgi:hypothetical protein